MAKKLLPFQCKMASIVIGSSLSKKKEFLYKWIFEGLKMGEPACFISTDASARDIKKDLAAQKFFFGRYENNGLLKFVDCYSHHTDEFLPDAADTKMVSGPLGLNEISIALSEIEGEFYRISSAHRIVFDSLSTILMYLDANAVGRFVQVIIARIKRAGGSVIFTLEEGMHDERTVVTLKHLMDGVIRLKKKGKEFVIKKESF